MMMMVVVVVVVVVMICMSPLSFCCANHGNPLEEPLGLILGIYQVTDTKAREMVVGPLSFNLFTVFVPGC